MATIINFYQVNTPDGILFTSSPVKSAKQILSGGLVKGLICKFRVTLKPGCNFPKSYTHYSPAQMAAIDEQLQQSKFNF